jgi:predicted dehydrogenase
MSINGVCIDKLFLKERLMASIGIGVIGCGFVGAGAHVPAVAAIDGARLIALADPDPKRLAKVARKHQPQSVVGDYADLLKDREIDAVIVAVPTPLHGAVAMAAINAGKHVLCEMPLTTNLEEADTMMAAARRAGVCLMPGLTYRFTPNYVKARDLIRRGTLGNISALHYREFIPARDLARQWPPGAWIWQLEQSGGPLFTLAVWSIDLCRWLLDTDVARANAAVRYTPLPHLPGSLGYDACATLTFASGVVAGIQYSGSVPESAAGSWLQVMGNSGSVLQASGNDTLCLFGEDPARTEWNLKEHGARAWGHYQQDEYFIRCLLEGREPEITPEDGRKAMEIAQRIARSETAVNA